MEADKARTGTGSWWFDNLRLCTIISTLSFVFVLFFLFILFCFCYFLCIMLICLCCILFFCMLYFYGCSMNEEPKTNYPLCRTVKLILNLEPWDRLPDVFVKNVLGQVLQLLHLVPTFLEMTILPGMSHSNPIIKTLLKKREHRHNFLSGLGHDSAEWSTEYYAKITKMSNHIPSWGTYLLRGFVPPRSETPLKIHINLCISMNHSPFILIDVT